jgi:4'-phosphopantetheinyl transferase EntD
VRRKSRSGKALNAFTKKPFFDVFSAKEALFTAIFLGLPKRQ